MIIDDVIQGQDPWRALHYGRATASQFSRIINPTAGQRFQCIRLISGETCGTAHTSASAAATDARKLNGKLPADSYKNDPFLVQNCPIELAAASRRYSAQLAGERLTKGPEDVQEFWSAHIQRGIDYEENVRSLYQMKYPDFEVRKVGFIRQSDEPHSPGCSPDGLIYDRLSGSLLGGLEVKCPNLADFQLLKEDGGLPNDYKCQVHGCLAITSLPWWELVCFHATCPDKALFVRVLPDDFTQAIRDVLPRFEAEVQKRVSLLQ